MVDKTLVLVTSSFPIRGNGSEAAGSFVADLVAELANRVQVRVVAPGVATGLERWAERVEVFRYAAPEQALSTLKFWRLSDLRWIARVLRGGFAATREAAAGDAVHMLALWGIPCGEWVRRVAKRRGVTYSVWLLGSDVWSLGKLPILRGMLARVIRRASVAYADGYRLAEDAQRIAGVPIQFLPSTRRVDRVGPPMRMTAPFRLLFLGRWHPNKGIDLLLDALDMLGDDGWRRIECIEIQGGGPMESWVRERVDALKKAGRPVEAGRFLAKSEAEEAMARADWVLIPSRIESIPVVFSDAMKMGRPVIASPVGDLPRLMAQAPCGVLAQSVSASAFLAALLQALGQVPADFASGTLSQAKQFDLATIARRIEETVVDHA